MRLARATAVLFLMPLVSCVNHLPDQDLRILETTPSARLSAADLWNDYAADAKKANRQYFGKALIVTGAATKIGSDAPTDRFVLFGQQKELGVRANLLDEQAAAILERATKHPLISVKCFCEGLDGNLVLKSCVTP